MKTLFKYRLLKAMWGIAIDIGGYHKLINSHELDAADIKIDENIYLRLELPYTLDKHEEGSLATGIKLAREYLNVDQRALLLIINELTFNPTDYHPEGLTGAIYGWLATQFAISLPPLEASFDRALNKYSYSPPVHNAGESGD